jgi:hypothetical protein
MGAAASSAEAAQIAQRSDAIGGPNVSGKHDDLFTRDGLASSCADPGVVSSPILTPALVEYHRYPFRSFVEQPVCVTVTLNTACAGADEVMSETYSPTYDPNNITVNWIADLGNSPPAATSYSFTLPPGAQFETVVDERNPGASCTGVTTTWTSDRPWASGTPFIDGAPALGQTLNAEQDVWAESPTVEKQWVRCDVAGANCTNIPGGDGIAVHAHRRRPRPHTQSPRDRDGRRRHEHSPRAGDWPCLHPYRCPRPRAGSR